MRSPCSSKRVATSPRETRETARRCRLRSSPATLRASCSCSRPMRIRMNRMSLATARSRWRGVRSATTSLRCSRAVVAPPLRSHSLRPPRRRLRRQTLPSASRRAMPPSRARSTPRLSSGIRAPSLGCRISSTAAERAARPPRRPTRSRLLPPSSRIAPPATRRSKCLTWRSTTVIAPSRCGQSGQRRTHALGPRGTGERSSKRPSPRTRVRSTSSRPTRARRRRSSR